MRKLFFLFVILLLLLVLVRVGLSIFFAPQLSNGEEVSFSTQILSAPTEQFGANAFTVAMKNAFGAQAVRIFTDQDLQYGQQIMVNGTIKKQVLSNKRVVYSIYFPTIEAQENQNLIVVQSLGFTQHLQSKILHVYASAMTTDDASLLLGIVLGVKGTFSSDLLTAFKTTGVMHVIAASGMNVTLVGGFLVSILGRFLKRQYVAITTILALVLYCFLAGGQPSIVRATIMGGLGLMGQLSGRQYAALYGLFLAGSGMLLLSPTLVQDVGFQLSFASSLGILVLHPHVSKLPILSEDIATTLSAQIATLPILLMTFGQYGVLSILVNALVLWTVAPLMIIGGIAAIIGLVILPIGSAISFLALPFLWYFKGVVLWFGSMRLTLTVDSLPMVWVVGYYLIIVAVILFLKQKHHEKILAVD